MKMAIVIGNVVSTIKTPSHQNWKLMIVQPVDAEGDPIAESLIAVDSVQAGIGDYVLVLEEGGSAREVMKSPGAAVEAIIVGIIDQIETNQLG